MISLPSKWPRDTHWALHEQYRTAIILSASRASRWQLTRTVDVPVARWKSAPMRHSNRLAFLTLVSLFTAACTDTTGTSSPAASISSGPDTQVTPSALQNDSRELVTILRHPNDSRLLRIHGDFVSQEQT